MRQRHVQDVFVVGAAVAGVALRQAISPIVAGSHRDFATVNDSPMNEEPDTLPTSAAMTFCCERVVAARRSGWGYAEHQNEAVLVCCSC